MFPKVITSSKFAKAAKLQESKHPLAGLYSKQQQLSFCISAVFLGLIVFLKAQLAIKEHVLK